MSESKHTPGPWACMVYTDGDIRSNHRSDVFGADGKRVAFVYADISRMHRIESSANARLIAAAPDLLAVCEVLIERCGLESIYNTDQKTGETFEVAIKAAIAKARGN